MRKQYIDSQEQYINEVKKELHFSGGLTKKILRDLHEAFDSAIEHGETVEQVINRLGTPAEFCSEMQRNMEGSLSPPFKKFSIKGVIFRFLWFISIFFIVIAIIIKRFYGDNHIGSADAMTQIKVQSILSTETTTLLLCTGIVLFISCLLIHVYKNKTNRRK